MTTDTSMATSGKETKLRTCPLCEARCGLELTVEDGSVTLIRGDRDDVWSKGYVCPKGTVLGKLHDDPDRLRTPMIRTGTQWREATWDEAFTECERLLQAVVEEHGKSAVTAYIGNPTAHNFSLGRYVGALKGMGGIETLYSAGTVDQWPKNVSSALMYGQPWKIPVPDLQRTDLLWVMGANPHASQGSLMGCADVLGEFDRIIEGDGRVVVIDPRRTGSADRASEWLPIQPGTDALFLLAVCNVLFADDLVELGEVAEHLENVDAVREVCADFTPESVSQATRIPTETIRAMTHELASTEKAVVYGRIGLCNQEFGTLASWLVDVVNILSGHFDVEGGLMFPRAVNWSMTRMKSGEFPDGYEFGRWNSRVRGAPEVLGQYPVSCMAEEIDTPGDGQIKALVTVAGNPVISAPDSGRLDEALPQLDAMISVDNWLNETTRHAHVILPGQSGLEQPHFDDLLSHFTVRATARWSDPVLPADPEQPEEWEIMVRLGAILMGVRNADIDLQAFDDGYFSAFVQMHCADESSPIHGRDPQDIVATYEGSGGPERFADFSVRVGPYGDGYGANPDGLTLAKIKEYPHGLDLGPMQPELPAILDTPNGKVDVAPPYIVADVDRLRTRIERPNDGLLLISRRHVRSNNSWLHNVKVLVKGKDRCTLMMHPDDAAARGLSDAQISMVTSENGTVEVPLEITDELIPGVVSLPHGWGHNLDGVRLSVAAEHAGVNNNLLAPPAFVDQPSGNAAVNGIPVEVGPC